MCLRGLHTVPGPPLPTHHPLLQYNTCFWALVKSGTTTTEAHAQLRVGGALTGVQLPISDAPRLPLRHPFQPPSFALRPRSPLPATAQGTLSDYKNELLFSQFGLNYSTLPERFRKVRRSQAAKLRLLPAAVARRCKRMPTSIRAAAGLGCGAAAGDAREDNSRWADKGEGAVRAVRVALRHHQGRLLERAAAPAGIATGAVPAVAAAAHLLLASPGSLSALLLVLSSQLDFFHSFLIRTA